MSQKEISKGLSSFDKRFSTLDKNNIDDFYNLNEQEWIKNEMWNNHLCTECQQEITNSQCQALSIRCFLCDWKGQLKDYENHLDLSHESWTCNCDCDELYFGCCIYEKLVTQKRSTAIRISLRLSSTQSTGASEIKNVFSQRMDIDKNVNILKKDITTVHDNIQHLNDELNFYKDSLQRLSQECSSLQTNCQEQNASISKLKSDQDMSEKNLLTIKQKMEDFHYATYDGSFIWKITDSTKKFDEARSGRRISIYSPLFCSSPTGYNMRARLDMYGDGDAQGTHISMFLVLCQGEYDAILIWPFKFPVTFCLFDQTGKGHHIVDSFYPDTKSTSFQRPRSEMNTASGIPKFCPLTAIEQQGNCYVQDDTMFIKIMLDFGGTPRSLLPYTSSLNPGLPIFVQEAIRLKEIEKYNKSRADLVAEINRNNQEVIQRSLILECPHLPARTRQQPPSSTTDSQSISCEDIPDDE